MNFKSQGTVRSEAEALAGFPDQQLHLAEEAFDASEQLCAATGGAGRKNRLLNNAQDGHTGLYVWLQPSRHPLPRALSLGAAAASKPSSVCSSWVLLRRFGSHSAQQSAEPTWAFKETCRALESEVAQWL